MFKRLVLVVGILGAFVVVWTRLPVSVWYGAGGRPTRFGKLTNAAGATWSGLGLPPRRMARLEVRGWRTGATVSLPVVIATVGGERYLVAMFGERSGWVRNVRAAGGLATLRQARREAIRLEEVPAAERAPILKEYLRVAPGGRPHIPVSRKAPIEEFEAIAGDYPVFRIVPA